MKKRKDMTLLHDRPKFGETVEKKSAVIKNHSFAGSPIDMSWDLNPVSKRDQIFKLKIGKEVALIDKQELLRYIRAV